ncbi:hypothetical protein [Nocardia sp. CDC160]|uniref:hypothetical protein n=1 Tax=Nocardia sp. CDC160 TaxID=3112166 RepID=UPI002DBD09EB|nr:hypothetical protein [Nocardia sp. CDC160]MEC3913314.1 hypothetical protein [Nocardia sp. CDC160]
MTRRRDKTAEQLEQTFERVLASALEGRLVRTHTGLDRSTRDALNAIARAHPDASEDLVEQARGAFAGQLDGSNAARQREEFDRKIRERAAQLKRSQ